MKVSIISVGSIKEKYLQLAIDEYSKRLRKYVKLNIIEVPDEKVPENLSILEREQAKLKEAKKILKHISNQFTIALCIDAKQLDSLEFAKFIQKNINSGESHLVFIIGGSLGLHKSVIDMSNFCISFSKMTFPHQLMRVILLEQIYRTQKILHNEPYHK